MYIPYREPTKVSLNLPWEKNTARGLVLAIVIYLVSVFLLKVVYVEPPAPFVNEVQTIPLDILNFGLGDGTGMSKGNLSKEGAAHKGMKPYSELEDAKIASNTKISKPSVLDDPNETTNIKASKEIASDHKINDKNPGSDNRNIGSPNGTSDGTGLGIKGFGSGAGEGLGDIEWGGGGNRTVLYKKVPVYPKGVNTGAQIKIRFKVAADGTVISMTPLVKADPLLEKAAMDALRQWRFNPLRENKEMIGVITFTFRLS